MRVLGGNLRRDSVEREASVCFFLKINLRGKCVLFNFANFLPTEKKNNTTLILKLLRTIPIAFAVL